MRESNIMTRSPTHWPNGPLTRSGGYPIPSRNACREGTAAYLQKKLQYPAARDNTKGDPLTLQSNHQPELNIVRIYGCIRHYKWRLKVSFFVTIFVDLKEVNGIKWEQTHSTCEKSSCA